jgi:hypothetical protein
LRHEQELRRTAVPGSHDLAAAKPDGHRPMPPDLVQHRQVQGRRFLPKVVRAIYPVIQIDRRSQHQMGGGPCIQTRLETGYSAGMQPQPAHLRSLLSAFHLTSRPVPGCPQSQPRRVQPNVGQRALRTTKYTTRQSKFPPATAESFPFDTTAVPRFPKRESCPPSDPGAREVDRTSDMTAGSSPPSFHHLARERGGPVSRDTCQAARSLKPCASTNNHPPKSKQAGAWSIDGYSNFS